MKDFLLGVLIVWLGFAFLAQCNPPACRRLILMREPTPEPVAVVPSFLRAVPSRDWIFNRAEGPLDRGAYGQTQSDNSSKPKK